MGEEAMTGRTCPVHAEYSASGVCRWCEPEDLVQMEYIPPTAHRPSRYWPVEGVTREEAVKMFGEPEPVIEVATWSTPPADEVWEPIRFDVEHAALRWERVARRWRHKAETRSYTVSESLRGTRCPCAACIADLINAGVPKEWP